MNNQGPSWRTARAALAKIVTLTLSVTGGSAALADPADYRRAEVSYNLFGAVIHAAKLNDFEYPFVAVTSPAFALVVHASPFWEPVSWIQADLNAAINEVKRSSVPVVVMASREERAAPQFLNFVTTISPTRILPYEGDSHRITFTGQKVMILGGNFTECACDAVRSLIAFSNGPLKVEFLSRAIYEIADPTTISRDRLDQLPASRIRSRRLADVLSIMSDQELLDYLKADYIAPDGLPCPDFKTPFVTRSQNYRYDVFRRGRHIGHIGDFGRAIELRFD